LSPKANLAHKTVAKTLKRRELVRQPPQVCGARSALAHHEHYNEPLAVTWLCRSHHGKHHVELDPRLRSDRRLTDALITHEGETLIVTEWAILQRLYPATLCHRIFHRAWPVALSLCLGSCKGRPRRRRVGRAARSVLITSSIEIATHPPRSPANMSFRRLRSLHYTIL